MKCPRYGELMIESVNYWFCGKHDPPAQVPVADEEGKGLHWSLALARDGSLWYEEAFDSYPSVIAHEYRRLQ